MVQRLREQIDLPGTVGQGTASISSNTQLTVSPAPGDTTPTSALHCNFTHMYKPKHKYQHIHIVIKIKHHFI